MWGVRSGFGERARRQSPGCLTVTAVLRNGFNRVFISAVSNVPRVDSALIEAKRRRAENTKYVQMFASA